MFLNVYCENFKSTYFEEHLRTTAPYFKPFSILDFALAKWFCRVACFVKVFSLKQFPKAYQKSGTQYLKAAPGTRTLRWNPTGET